MTLIELNSLIDNMKIEVNTKTSNLVNAITEQMNQLKISLEEKMRRAFLNTVDRNISRPTIQASMSTFGSPTTTSLDFNVTNIGNGDRVLCMIGLTSNTPPTSFPVDGSSYTANTAWGVGSAIGNFYVVYNSASTGTFSVTGLSRNRTSYTCYAYSYDDTTKTYFRADMTQNKVIQTTLK